MRASQDVVHGAWARRAVSVDGSDRFETQHVVWIQCGACYADLRVPFVDGVGSRFFAGRSGWDGGDRYRWERSIDSEPFPGEDVGELSWEDGVLVERGLFGGVPYVEEWVRLPGDDGLFLAAEGPDGRLVRVGNHAISVTSSASVYWIRRAEAWHEERRVGDAFLPSPDEPLVWRIVHRGTTEVAV